MPKGILPNPEIVASIKQSIATDGLYRTASRLNMHHNTLAKLADGLPVSPSTLRAVGATALRSSPKVRDADEFKVSTERLRPPRSGYGQLYNWDLAAIRGARNDQLVGKFERPSDLAKAMRTDDALFTARQNRIAPQSALAAELKPAPGVRGEAIAKKARWSIVTPRSALKSINGTLADHGVAFGYVIHEPAEDGSIVNMRLTPWPIRWVEWNPSAERFETRVRDGGVRVPIRHGDGHWIIFQKTEDEPWTDEACVLPGAIIFAGHAFGLRDWAKGTTSHGNAKVVGEMPEGQAIQGVDGSLTPQAEAFWTMLQDMVSDSDQFAGLIPPGAKVDFINNSGNAWQVFSEFVLNREKAAARVYLGTDGMLGSVGGAPGVDIATLFGVATTKIQGDLEAIQRGLKSGLYDPWTAINFGDSSLAPSLEYLIPDPDADAKQRGQAERREKFYAAVEAHELRGFEINQDIINALAAEYGIPAPKLAAKGESKIKLELAPTDVAIVIRGREARAAQGLPPFGDERDDMTIAQIKARAEATVSPPSSDQRPPE